MGCCSSSIDETKDQKKLIKLGDKLPHFALQAHDGSTADSSEIIKEKNLVVVFYRGGWCPFCNLQLRGLQKKHNDILERNTTIVAIAPEKLEGVVDTAKARELTFPACSDPGLAVARNFGIVYRVAPTMAATHNFAKWNSYKNEATGAEAEGHDELPLPTTVIAEQGSGKIIFCKVEGAKGASAALLGRVSGADIVGFLQKHQKEAA